MDEEQALFEQSTLSDFKKWGFKALKTFKNYSRIMCNNSGTI